MEPIQSYMSCICVHFMYAVYVQHYVYNFAVSTSHSVVHSRNVSRRA